MHLTGLQTHLTGLQTHLTGLQPYPHFLFLLELLFFLQEPYPVFFAKEPQPYPKVFTACFFVGIAHNLQSCIKCCKNTDSLQEIGISLVQLANSFSSEARGKTF